MQTATSETESKSLDVSICVHHYTLRAPCPKSQGKCRTLNYCWVVVCNHLSAGACNGSVVMSAKLCASTPRSADGLQNIVVRRGGCAATWRTSIRRGRCCWRQVDAAAAASAPAVFFSFHLLC